MSTTDNAALIAAQNRTTHAVRAIGIYFLYSALFNLIGGVIIVISCATSLNSYEGLSSAIGGIVFGGIVIAAGAIYGLFKGLSELAESAVKVSHAPAVQAASDKAVSSPQAQELLTGNVVCKYCGNENDVNKFRCATCDALVE